MPRVRIPRAVPDENGGSGITVKCHPVRVGFDIGSGIVNTPSFLIGVGALLATAFFASPATAQPRPGTVQPGQIERQLERPPEPTARPGAITIPEGTQAAPPNAEGIRFALTRLTVDGVTVYKGDALQKLYAASLGTEVTLAEIYRIAERLTAKYRNDGYILSQVIVPAQAVEGGAVRLQAVEGYIADVRVEGGSAALNARARKYGSRIRASRPLTAGDLERYVLLLNDLPGVQARAVLAPGATPGAADLVLQVTQTRVRANASADTRGSRAQGRQRAFGNLALNSLLGTGSLTELRAVSTGDRELGYAAGAHDQFIGSEGTRIGVAGSYVYSKPAELAFIPLELTTRSQTITLNVSHPLIRSRARNLYARATLSAFNSTSTVFGVKDTQDRVRAVRVGLTFDTSDRLGGINIADIEFSQGLSGLGASTNGDQYLSRPTGRTDFRRTNLYAARFQSLPANFSIALGLNAQYAFTDLLAPELFSAGGEQFGRGYDFAEILNDHGGAVKVDLRYTHRVGARSAVMPYAFYDYGQVWQRTRFAGLDRSQSLASTGGGIRLNIGSHLAGFVEYAQPLTKIIGQENNRKGRVYSGLTIQ